MTPIMQYVMDGNFKITCAYVVPLVQSEEKKATFNKGKPSDFPDGKMKRNVQKKSGQKACCRSLMGDLFHSDTEMHICI